MLTLYKLPKLNLEARFKHRLREGLIESIIIPKNFLDNLEVGDIVEVEYTDTDTDLFVVRYLDNIRFSELDVGVSERAGFEFTSELETYLKERFGYEELDELEECTVQWINSYKINKSKWYKLPKLLKV